MEHSFYDVCQSSWRIPVVRTMFHVFQCPSITSDCSSESF